MKLYVNELSNLVVVLGVYGDYNCICFEFVM